jgi:hypothetical protein
VQKQARQRGTDDFTLQRSCRARDDAAVLHLRIRKLQPPLRLGLQDAIFGGSDIQSAPAADGPPSRVEDQNARPIHLSSPPADCCPKIVASGTR